MWESTCNWFGLVDGLMEAGYELHLVNTAAVKQYEGLKHRDDLPTGLADGGESEWSGALIQIPSPSMISTRDPLSRKRMRLFSLTHCKFFSPDRVLPPPGTS